MPNIRTYCRIKPTKDVYPEHELENGNTIYINVPEVLRDYTTPTKGGRAFINHVFHFDHIFEQDATQENVFEVSARTIVQGFMTGYNGTIFAYGQTGTGKTYTVEGSAKTYQQRGLEPRALSLIYQELEKRTDEDISIHISYLEIYQEVGYDLLNPGARTQSFVTPFPKVHVLEGHNGMCIIRNLSNHLAASEEVAQSLLLQGQANRKVAATAVHERSSRSHAVFTIQLTAKKPESNTVIRSKLHLVDLAGSERVAKTGVHGAQLTEAKSINLSLHHLESVIIALQSDSVASAKRIKTSLGGRKYQLPVRPQTADGVRVMRHVPYRNSLLTMVLRDSLGGNCMTAMIATVSLEFINIGESISTCRFAGRVACIANSVSRNEELDEKSLIKKLRKKINELEAEIACLKLEQSGETPTVNQMSAVETMEEDRTVCVKVIQQYLAGRINDPISAGITNPYRFRECLKILKGLIQKNNSGSLAIESNNKTRSLTSLRVNVPSHIPEGGGDSQVDVADSTLQVIQPSADVQILKVHDDPVDEQEPRHVPNSAPTVRKTVAAWGEENRVQQDRPPAVRKSVSAGGEDGRGYRDKQGYSRGMKESREPDTLSQMLTDAGIQKVKAPFEQKREKEIKKLNNKVEKLESDRLEKENQVVNIKLMVAEQELGLMERHMRTKMGVTTSQVEDQRAYIEQLKITEAESSLIEQEKLVEQQLKKRQARFEKQLEYIEKRRHQLKTHVDTDLSAAEKKASVQEKYGQFRKHDGSLNTRQVFQMLKSEERKQTKAKNQVEKEKIIATSNLMEMRELATRQRLRELKEMMKTGSTIVPHDKSLHNKSFEQSPSLTNGHSEPAKQNGLDSPNFTGKREPKTGKEGPSSMMTGGHSGQVNGGGDAVLLEDFDPSEDVQQKEPVQPRPGSSVSAHSSSSKIPDSEFYAKKKRDKDPKSKWESSYSRPTTPSNLQMDDGFFGNVYVPKVKNGVLVNGHADKLDKPQMENKTQNNTSSQKSTDQTETHIKSSTNASPAKVTQKNGFTSKQDKTSSKVEIEQTMDKSSKRTSGSDSQLTSDIIESESRRLEEELLDSKRRGPLHRTSSDSKVTQKQTYMPSEYIHKMADGDRFDASKMGLSSKNFDSALSSMLEKENANAGMKHEDYDQFARTAPYHVSPYIQQASLPPPHRQKLRSSGQTSRGHSGSEEKGLRSDNRGSSTVQSTGSPISSKISRYLQQSSGKEKKRSVKSSGENAEKTYDVRDVSQYRQSSSDSLLEHKPTLEIEEERPGKVTAMLESERENTFMSKAHSQRDRVKKIRIAQLSAEKIQRAWRRYKLRTIGRRQR